MPVYTGEGRGGDTSSYGTNKETTIVESGFELILLGMCGPGACMPSSPFTSSLIARLDPSVLFFLINWP